MNNVTFTWYGRCCFLIGLGKKKILIDPHDTFDHVDMGFVEADYCLSSSVAHDHGHIGASPKAYTIGSAGRGDLGDFVVTGIMSKESRGTPNVIFNIRYQDYSITNFADFGDERSLDDRTDIEDAILKSTNIALVRPNKEVALQFCDPQIVIVHHFYPESFIKRHTILDSGRVYFPQVEEFVKKIGYERKIVSSYSFDIHLPEFKKKNVLQFEEVHPQVTIVV